MYSDTDVLHNLPGPVCEMLVALGRHNMRPSHLHIMVQAPGFRKLVTQFYPEGDKYLSSDAVFGVKKSLIVVSQLYAAVLSSPHYV